MFGIVDESNWTVCSQEPATGTEISVTPRITVDRKCDSKDTLDPGSGDEGSESDPAESTTEETVPRLAGLTKAQAERNLAALGLVAVISREVPSPLRRGTVLRQLRKVGASVTEGSSVGLVIASPYPVVPGTAGLTQAIATERLRAAGFRVAVTSQVVTSGQDGVVLRQTPIGSSRVAPNSLVTVVVANVVRPVVAAPPPSNCTAGYQPCLAPASDYDCAGGSGDGPAYANGPIYVTGSDPYGLDSENDGIACE